MRHSIYSKVIALVVAGLLASCSSPGQSVEKTMDVEKMSPQTLSIGIESTKALLVTFYIVNNTASDINMLTWNTPFESMLSADIFLVTRGAQVMPYLGRKVKRSSPGANDYLIIPAGEKRVSTTDIAKYYGLTQPGEYTVTINLPTIDGAVQLNQETVVTVEVATLDVVVK